MCIAQSVRAIAPTKTANIQVVATVKRGAKAVVCYCCYTWLIFLTFVEIEIKNFLQLGC